MLNQYASLAALFATRAPTLAPAPYSVEASTRAIDARNARLAAAKLERDALAARVARRGDYPAVTGCGFPSRFTTAR